MKPTQFEAIVVGSVTGVHKIDRPISIIHGGRITIHYPARLESMALDPAKVAEREDRIYRAGQINLVVSIFKHVTVRIIDGEDEIRIPNNTPRFVLVKHAALIMKSVLGFKQSIAITITEDLGLRHCGLGSSSGTIAAIASAINELFSKPLNPSTLSKLCAQNHGEEIDGNTSMVIPVQCLGGSVIAGNFEGGLMIIAGRATPIFSMDLKENLSVVIGVPNDYYHPDSAELMQQEADNMNKFVSTGNAYASEVAYNLIHEVIPDLTNGELESCKELIYQYRWNMGSIKNCSFVLPRIVDIAESLRKYQTNEDIKIFSLSSVGPGFFALTSNPEKVLADFKTLNMKTYVTKIYNNTYKVGE